MKITQEVRDFAAKQNAGVESFFAAEEAGSGMAEMAQKYQDSSDLYMPSESYAKITNGIV